MSWIILVIRREKLNQVSWILYRKYELQKRPVTFRQKFTVLRRSADVKGWKALERFTVLISTHYYGWNLVNIYSQSLTRVYFVPTNAYKILFSICKKKKTLEARESFYMGSMVNVFTVRTEFYDYMQIKKELFWTTRNLHFYSSSSYYVIFSQSQTIPTSLQ